MTKREYKYITREKESGKLNRIFGTWEHIFKDKEYKPKSHAIYDKGKLVGTWRIGPTIGTIRLNMPNEAPENSVYGSV